MKSNIHLTVALTLVTMIAPPALFATDPAEPSVPPEAARTKLMEGNLRFATSPMSKEKPTAERRTDTAQSQHPFAVILGCADSRVSPELVFDQNLGDLFVIRTAGNLIDDHALGSIEYAVEHLGTRLIVVLGHSSCGAVKAALESDHAPGHVNSLVRDIQPAVNATKGDPGDKVAAVVNENAKEVAARIRTEAELGDLAKEVQVVSAVYDLKTGKVEWADK